MRAGSRIWTMLAVALTSCRAVTGLGDLELDSGPGGGGSGGGTPCTCTLPQSEATCAPDGSCAISACDTGFESCDGSDATGCETATVGDADNCGQCGHDCLEGACLGGRCQPVVLAENVGNPTVLAVDGPWVFYATTYVDTTTVERVPTIAPDGLPATPDELVSEAAPPIHGIAVDDETLYWGSQSGNAIRRRPLSGGPVTKLYDAAGPWDLKRDGDLLYWTERGPGLLRRGAIGGGMPEDLVSGLTRPFELVVDTAHVYWTDDDEITLNRVPIEGGSPELGIGTSNRTDVRGMGLSANSGAVYWTGSSPGVAGDVLRYDKTTGDDSVFVSGDVTRSVAADETHVYWVDKLKNAVLRRPIDGGVIEVLAEQQLSAQGLVLDDTAAYWANFSGASIVKVAK